MPVQTTWHIENRVLYYEMRGQVDLDDIQQLNDDYTRFSAQTSQPIHSIANLQQLENLKLSMNDMVQLRNVKTFGGWTVVVRGQASAFSKAVVFFIKMAEHVFGMHLTTVDSVEAAEQFLREKDPTLAETVRV